MNHRSFSTVLATSVLLTACGGGAPPPPPPVTVTIGAAGGTVNGPSGATVVIPAGALAKDTPIGIAQSDAGAPALPAGATTLGAMFAFTPHGTVFAKPVTMTVPFDPGKVPAGTTPVLLKTNAAMNGWDTVAGATVSGSVMTAQVTGFSLLIVTPQNGLLRGDPKRDWEFKAFAGDGTLKSVKKPPPQTGGLVDDTYQYNGGGIGNVHSTEDGKTYWAFASSPRGSILDASSQIGNQVWLHHLQSFTKVEADANLKLTITAVTLNAAEISASDILPYECVVKPECDLYAYSAVNFWVSTYGRDHDDKYWSFYASGRTEMSDRGINASQPTPCKRDWKVDYGIWGGRVPDDQITPLWGKDDFEEAATSNNCGYTVKLKKPITIFINLSKVDVGKDFTLETDVLTSTYNEAGGEGGLFAYFRDPVNPVGGTLEYTGLKPSSNPPTPRQPPEALPACQTGPDPAAGTLQFGAASYYQKEVPVSRNPILVTRTGGSKGAASARVRSSDGSAHAGTDYTAVDTVVLFGDGDAQPRTVEVPLTLDTIAEPDKNLTLTLSDPRGCGALGAQKTATLSILDNDRLIPDNSHTLGGTVSGLTGTGLVLEDGHFNRFTPIGNGPFTFNLRYQPNTTYDVQVVAQPSNPIQTCSVTDGKGTITADVTKVAVNCVTPGQNPALDASFGGGKVASSRIGSAVALALQGDGKILALSGGALARFNPDGSLDAGFGPGGAVTIAFKGGSSLNTAQDLALQNDGKIVVVGKVVPLQGFNDDFALVRLNPDGSLDAGFGSGGTVNTDFGGSTDRANAVFIQPDGRIVVAGSAVVGSPLTTDFAVARYASSGALDSSLGGNGKVTINIAGLSDIANAVVVQGDGKIVLTGAVEKDNASNSDVGLVRLNPDGGPDTGFGGAGTGVVQVDLSKGGSDSASDLTLQPDGKILVSGTAPTNFMVARFTPGGTLDSTFGSQGLAAADISTGLDFGNDLALQADGKIVVVGDVSALQKNTGDFGVVRYNADGSLDAGFGSGGKLRLDFFGADDGANAVVIQPDGKIVVGGFAKNGSSAGIGLVRVNP